MNERRAPLVLVVDDEQPIRELVRTYLKAEQMDVIVAEDGPAAVEAVREHRPDVVVLDVMLPGIDGIEVCRQMRAFSDAYVLMLTARGEEVDRVVGLNIGADDYLVKPFSPRELVARIKALLRRPRAGSTVPGPAGLTVDPQRHLVAVDDRPISLTVIEFDLLATLARDPGTVVTREQLLDRVWGQDFMGDDHLIDVHIAKLRGKLGDDPAEPRFVETVRGVGFRLRDR
ncbi:MAG: response regulator transcription factor [Chloroflexota bacterium]|nr:response regulator transcription factor [Chloroflexota bacterium]